MHLHETSWLCIFTKLNAKIFYFIGYLEMQKKFKTLLFKQTTSYIVFDIALFAFYVLIPFQFQKTKLIYCYLNGIHY